MASLKEKFIIKGLILIFLTVVFFISVAAPLYEKNKLLNTRIRKKEAMLLHYEQILAQDDLIQAQYRKAFPSAATADKDSTVRAFKELEVMTQKCFLTIIDIRQRDIAVEEFPEILIELKTQGQKSDYIRFIFGLKYSALLFRIKSFTLKPQKDTHLLEAKFSIAYIPAL